MVLHILTGYGVLRIVYLDQLLGTCHTYISHHDTPTHAPTHALPSLPISQNPNTARTEPRGNGYTLYCCSCFSKIICLYLSFFSIFFFIFFSLRFLFQLSSAYTTFLFLNIFFAFVFVYFPMFSQCSLSCFHSNFDFKLIINLLKLGRNNKI